MKLGATLVDPKNIIFENDLDIIDYATAGVIPPRKANFDLVMNTLSMRPESSEIQIHLQNIDDPQLLIKYAKRAYENRCKATAVGFGLGVATAVTVGVVVHNLTKKDD